MLKDESGFKSTWLRGLSCLRGYPLPLASGSQAPSDPCHQYSQILVSFSPCGLQRIPCIATKMFLASHRDCCSVHGDFSLALAHVANSCGLSKDLQDREDLCSPGHNSAVHTKSHTAGLRCKLTSRVLVLVGQELISSKECN